MFISEIHASGFRCFSATRSLRLALRPGLNIIVGPNDAGKTAVIDAPRYVLWTRGDEFIRLDVSDFHVDADGVRATELMIRCTFEGLSPVEEARFLEWCTNEAGVLRLHVCLKGALRENPGGGHSVTTQYRAGQDGDGLAVEGDLREYLKSTYLRPLRDAERELRSGRRSRLSRILGALPVMATQSRAADAGQPPSLMDTLSQADAEVERNLGVQSVQESVNQVFLSRLGFTGDELAATLGLGVKGSFDQILERFELYLNPAPGKSARTVRGLGYNNLLFMAAELLLLQSHPEQVPFLLIEEPEAHLHPQHQSLFMKLLAERAREPGVDEQRKQVQILLTTHSPHLAAGADVDVLVMMIGHAAHPLAKGRTRLDDDDYEFLRRFLDATKANLFFARGLVVVEGDAENLLLPAMARAMGRGFEDHGVSIVNVGHTGLFRYSRILQRVEGDALGIPVALLHDRDVPPDEARPILNEERKTESDYQTDQLDARVARMRREDGQGVQAFISEQWTLEFDLALRSDMADLLHRAISLARFPRTDRAQVIANADAELVEWRREDRNPIGIAVRVFEPIEKRQVSKAETAEQLAGLIDALEVLPEAFRAMCPSYLVAAIDYVTGVPAREDEGQAA